MSLLLGCRRDTPDPNDFSFERSAIVAEPNFVLSQEIDLTPFLPAIDRQIAENCVQHMLRGQAMGTAAFAGHPIDTPSVLFPYAFARRIDPTIIGLVDVGSSPRLTYKAVSPKRDLKNRNEFGGYGLIAEERWREVPENVNVMPPEDCFREGENAFVQAYYRIMEGQAAPTAIIAALRRGRFPSVCCEWDEKIKENDGAIHDSPGGRKLGGHALLACGYSPTLDAFRIRNSHGVEFGEAGYMWMSARFVATYAYDIWVAEIVPERVM